MDAIRTVLVFTAISALLIFARPAQAQTETVLYSFCSQPSCADGANPYGGLVMDKKGNLYGTTYGGGTYIDGTIFKLSRTGSLTVLHSFNNDGMDGYFPYSGLVKDKKGNFYGTASNGGTYNCGAVFKFSPSGGETILFSFSSPTGDADGCDPYAGLVIDGLGNLYGTTAVGGAYNNYGTVFELSASGNQTPLYSFAGPNGDGANPYAGVILDKQGNLYGTTTVGGVSDFGTVFKVSPSGEETVLYNFAGGTDGRNPYGALAKDGAGNLYGTTAYGDEYGNSGGGIVFELVYSKKTQTYTEKVLYSFGSQSSDAVHPFAGVIMDRNKNLYGTTRYGGAYGNGTVFELVYSKDTKKYSEKVLYSFTGGADGQGPYDGLIMDSQGNLYGTTWVGGANGWGTVFKLTP